MYSLRSYPILQVPIDYSVLHERYVAVLHATHSVKR